MPVYFDSTYDLFRADKYAVASAPGTVVDAYTGWLGSLGFSLFGDLLVFNASLDGPFTSDRDPCNYQDWPHFFAQFLLGKGLVPNVSLELSYDKRKLGADEGFLPGPVQLRRVGHPGPPELQHRGRGALPGLRHPL